MNGDLPLVWLVFKEEEVSEVLPSQGDEMEARVQFYEVGFWWLFGFWTTSSSAQG